MVNTKLRAAAQAHAQDMADRQFYSSNMLMPELREIGVGVLVQPSSERGSYWVRVFGAGVYAP